jgi:hypothetical protein
MSYPSRYIPKRIYPLIKLSQSCTIPFFPLKKSSNLRLKLTTK